MKRKQLWKVLGTGGLALSLMVSPLAGVSALAAEDTPTGTEGDGTAGTGGSTTTPAAGTDDAAAAKEGGSVKGINPLQKAKEGSEAVGTEGEAGYVPAVPAVEAYADTEIPVWGFTEDSTVYSVDVEWGAMTFQYENSSWDPETHMAKAGAGWRVFDSAADEALDDEETIINEIKVTNHSNAGVWATLTYAAKEDHTDIAGDFSFTSGTEDGDTNSLTAAAGTVPAYLTLLTADNSGDKDVAGTPTVGKAYFMPDGIGDTDKTDGIEKWTTIGTITVGIKTEQPGTATTTTPDEETEAPEVTGP